MRESLTRRIGLIHPIIQAPMGGGGDTPSLAAAVSEAGGLGSLGLSYRTPAEIVQTVAALRAKTSRPFAINLFAPLPPPVAEDAAAAIARVAPFYAELGLPVPEPPLALPAVFDAQFAVALESGASVFSFTFGIVPPEVISAARASGMLVAGTATTVAEAVALERAGVDIVVAQGSEAGGHRGTFAASFEAALIGTMALVPQVVDAVGVPVVAAGGIMDGRGIAAALALGAEAAQMGTAFLTCEEAGVPDAYKQAILEAHEDQTRVTHVLSGRPARGIANRYMMDMDRPGVSDAVLPFPLQAMLLRPLRAEAGARGRADFLGLMAGQGLRLARRMPAGALVGALAEETAAAVERLRSR